MRQLTRSFPVALAVSFGTLTLFGLLFVPALSELLTGWALFLIGVALVLGIVNLLGVHTNRLAKGNVYSGILVLSMLVVFVLAITDGLGITDRGVRTVFELVQLPLEAAMASLLAFFLLFAGFRMLQRDHTKWAALFIVTVIIILASKLPLPAPFGDVMDQIGSFIDNYLVNAGVRGILIGVAIGMITVSLRVLTGSERPYSK